MIKYVKRNMPGMTKNEKAVEKAGVYYVCYKLSKLGWNVVPTCYNEKGVDILIWDQSSEQKRMHTIEVKSAYLYRRPVDLNNFTADYLVICTNIRLQKKPLTTYICSREQIREDGHGNDIINISYYRKFENNWKLIGKG